MILALDLSTPRGSLAVVSEHAETVFSEHFQAHRSHNALVFDPLKRALAACGNDGPTLVAIGTGPGSYTGVRVAIAAGIGVAMSIGVPIFGVPSAFAAVTEAGESEENISERFLLVGDARRGKYYGIDVGGFSAGQDLGASLYEPGELRNWIGGHPDLGVWTFDPKRPEPAPMAGMAFPDARRLAGVVAGFEEHERDRLAESPLEPVYLSAPFVTTPKG